MANIQVPISELKKRKLFLAAPMYGGGCQGMFARSIADLSALCVRYEIPLQMYFLFNESLIPRARNYCCDEFMRSECTHMMFIDSDIGFNPNDVIGLLALASEESEYDIIGGPYPKKCISWEKIKLAVDKGFADEDPNKLDAFVGDYVFNPKGGQTQIPLGEPVEVLEIGTGFMLVRKSSMIKFQEAYPQYMYKPDHVRTEHFDGSREIMQFFQAEIDPVSKRYLSEDYWFCCDSQTQITTEDGIKPIKEIVDTKYSGKVLSMDKEGNLVFNKILNWWSRPNGKRGKEETKKKWVTFDTDADNNTKSKAKITEDHSVFCFEDIFNPKIKELEAKDVSGKYIVRKPQNFENVLYSSDQLSFLIGTLMGDSSINKAHQISCQHSDKQEDYINLKAKLFNGKVNGPVPNRGYGEGKFKYVLHAPINAQTKKLRELFYVNGKKTVQKIVDFIDEKVLAFWYMDDGSLNNGLYARIATNSFSLEDHETLKKVLFEKYNISVEIDLKKVKGNEYYSLRMNKEDSERFFNLIHSYIPECMNYKLPKKYQSYNDKFNFDEVKSLGFAASFVKMVRYLPKWSSRLYDIEVENTHNFFANGMLVHNCQKAQAIGMKTWLCPWMKLQHVGTMIFGGSLIDIAALGASATADPDQLAHIQKRKKKEGK